jgi:hypothetical protein
VRGRGVNSLVSSCRLLHIVSNHAVAEAAVLRAQQYKLLTFAYIETESKAAL